MSTLKLENIKHENSSTNNMVMDSDGTVSITNKMGIGTSTPDYALTVEGTSNPRVRINSTDNTASGVFMHVSNSGSQTGSATTRIDGTGNYSIYNGTTSSPLNMNIDGSGRVTMPSQVGFSYLGSKSYVIGGTGITAMSSSNVWASNVNHAFNRGSHFNASTGRFTCPITGRYQFHFRCQASNFSSGYLWFYLRLNQSVFSYAQKTQEAAHTTMYLGGILELSANDYVDVAWTNNYVSGQIHYPEFSGMLIG